MPHTFFIGDHQFMFPQLKQKIILWERKQKPRAILGVGGVIDTINDDKEEEIGKL